MDKKLTPEVEQGVPIHQQKSRLKHRQSPYRLEKGLTGKAKRIKETNKWAKSRPEINCNQMYLLCEQYRIRSLPGVTGTAALQLTVLHNCMP